MVLISRINERKKEPGIGEDRLHSALRRSVKIMIVLEGEISRQIICLSRDFGERTTPTGLRYRWLSAEAIELFLHQPKLLGLQLG